MNKKTGLIAGIITVSGLLIGFGIYLYRQYRSAMKFDYTFGNFKIRNFTKDRILFEFDFIIKNNSELDCALKQVKFDVFMNGKHIGYVDSVLQTTIKPKGITTIPINLDINPQKAFTLQEILTLVGYYLSKNYGSIVFDYKGFIKIHKVKDFTININNKINLKEML